MTKAQFGEWWTALESTLKPGTEVFHWSAHSQYQLNGSFRILSFESDRVWIDIAKPSLPATKTVRPISFDALVSGRIIPIGPPVEVPINQKHYVSRHLFFRPLELWGDYCKQIISRKSMDAAGGSTYVISIIRWMEKNSR
jgi:hypothetical protein